MLRRVIGLGFELWFGLRLGLGLQSGFGLGFWLGLLQDEGEGEGDC